MEKRKPGRPKGSGTGKRAKRGPYATGNFPEGAYTKALYKACKRIDMARKSDPSYGLGDAKQRARERKKLNVIDQIAEEHVLSASKGNKEDRETLVNRMEGKAVSRTENNTFVGGEIEHTGFKVTFEAPKQLDSRETIDVTPNGSH